jgi:hypothetical protein
MVSSSGASLPPALLPMMITIFCDGTRIITIIIVAWLVGLDGEHIFLQGHIIGHLTAALPDGRQAVIP